MKTRISPWPAIGPGLYLSNRGGIRLGAEKIGAECTILHSVTIGRDREGNIPTIGDRVWIGNDTVVYGKIEIGKGVTICGETVLGKSVPDKTVVKGKPGRIHKRNYSNDALLREPVE